MILARVDGSVYSTVMDPSLKGKRLLLIQPIDLSGADLGRDVVAIDHVQAGPGERVLAMKEGGGARILLKDNKIPVQYVVVAVVDGLELTPGEA